MFRPRAFLEIEPVGEAARDAVERSLVDQVPWPGEESADERPDDPEFLDDDDSW